MLCSSIHVFTVSLSIALFYFPLFAASIFGRLFFFLPSSNYIHHRMNPTKKWSLHIYLSLELARGTSILPSSRSLPRHFIKYKIYEKFYKNYLLLFEMSSLWAFLSRGDNFFKITKMVIDFEKNTRTEISHR